MGYKMVMDQRMDLAAATGSLGSMEETTCGSMNAGAPARALAASTREARPARLLGRRGRLYSRSANTVLARADAFDRQAPRQIRKKTAQLWLLKGKFPQNGKVPRET
jgi:hypothetical protein